MKIKVFTPAISVSRSRENAEPYLSTTVYGGYNTRFAAMNQINSVIDFYSQKDDDGKIIEPREWNGNIVAVDSTIFEEVIDTDDYEEHRPDYDVEIEVTITKRVTVCVTSDDLEAGGWDQDDVELCAEGMYENGDFDDEIEQECEYDRDMEIRDYEEQ